MGPASFFHDACTLIVPPPSLATTTHVVGHLLREIEGNLLDVLHEQLVAPLPSVTSLPPTDLIPAKPSPSSTVVAEGAKLLSEQEPDETIDGEAKGKHKRKVKAILTALGFPLDGPEAQQWLAMAGGRKRLHRVAHRDQLNSPRPVTKVFLDEVDAIVRLFDAVLERFESRYANVYERLDALLVRPVPGSDGIDLLKKATPNTHRTLSYFFGSSGK
jgi:hypothetical protein